LGENDITVATFLEPFDSKEVVMKETLWVRREKAQELADDLRCCGLTVEMIFHPEIVELRVYSR